MVENKLDDLKKLDKPKVLETSVAKKATRISIGLYRLTDYFDDREPLKYSVRENCGELLSLCLSFTKDGGIYRTKVVKDIKDSISKLITRFDVLEYGGIVSDRNANLIKDELLSLNALVENSDLDLSNYLRELNLSTLPSNKPETIAAHEPLPRVIISDRKTRILAHIKSKGSATIRDLTNVVKGCSEKTIQRELIALIDDGQLRREGERRWSRYLIAN